MTVANAKLVDVKGKSMKIGWNFRRKWEIFDVEWNLKFKVGK